MRKPLESHSFRTELQFLQLITVRKQLTLAHPRLICPETKQLKQQKVDCHKFDPMPL